MLTMVTREKGIEKNATFKNILFVQLQMFFHEMLCSMILQQYPRVAGAAYSHPR